MTIKTHSAFTYGHTITENNQWIDFSENGIDQLSAQIEIGTYTLGEFADAVSTALNSTLLISQEYTVTLDRSTRMLTISAGSNFDLLITSGDKAAISAYTLMGFTGADLTGANSYTANNVTGSIYYPQFKLQSFVDFNDNISKAESSVKQSASGEVEVVSYGEVKIMECNITFITDIVPQGVILENPTGVSDLRNFLIYATTKAKLEFIPDSENLNVFTKCILEKTREGQDGTAFKLKELYSRGLAEYFETGVISFREIN